MKLLLISFLSLSVFANSTLDEIQDHYFVTFKTGHTPTASELNLGEDWLCDTFHFRKGLDDELVREHNIGNRYFNFSQDNFAMVDRYEPRARYMPLDLATGETLNGLYSPIAGVGRSFMDQVIRVIPSGELMFEESVGMRSAVDRNYRRAHHQAPLSITTQYYNNYQSLRVVSVIGFCRIQ